MKFLELDIFSEAELRSRPVYVFRRVDRAGQSKYAFVMDKNGRRVATFEPSGNANLLFYTSRESAENSLQRMNDPSIKLSIVPMSSISTLEKSSIKQPDASHYVLYVKDDDRNWNLAYQAIYDDGEYTYTVGKSGIAKRNRLLKFNNPKDAAYFANRYYKGKPIQVRPVSGEIAT